MLKNIFKSVIAGVPAGFVFIIFGNFLGTIQLPQFVQYDQLYLIAWLLSVYLGLGIVFSFLYGISESALKSPRILKGILFGVLLWSISVVPMLVKLMIFSDSIGTFRFFVSAQFFIILLKDLFSFVAVTVVISVIYQRYLK